jgi:hypothetical protein
MTSHCGNQALTSSAGVKMGVRNNPEMVATKMFDLARKQIQGLKLQPLTLQNCVSLAPTFCVTKGQYLLG